MVDAVAQHIPSPQESTKRIIDLNYSGDRAGQFYEQIVKCQANGPLLVHTVKLYNKADCKSFDVFGRVLSGTIS